MSDSAHFARLVSLACHDLRTPLATVYGFARTLANGGELDAKSARYVEMIEAASQQLAGLLDEVSLAARIEAGRYEPVLQERDTLELAQAAAGRAGEAVIASGTGVTAELDAEPLERALAGLARAAQRHGGVEPVEIAVDGRTFRIAPVVAAAAPVVLAEELKDLGAAVAVRLVGAVGGTVELADTTLVVRV